MAPQIKPEYRGVQLGDKTPEAVQAVLDCKANLIRYQLVTGWDSREVKDPTSYRIWLDQELSRLDYALTAQPDDVCGVLDLHVPPGGMSSNGTDYAMFSTDPTEFWCVECFFQTWKYLVNRYKDNPKIHVYGILNEPRSQSATKVVLLMSKTIKLIREFDQNKFIAVTGRYSSPAGIRNLKLLDDPKLWYEIHMYDPIPFTHQGIAPLPIGQVYPSASNTRRYVFDILWGVRDFQLKYDLKTIFVGEFSCIKYADVLSRYKYLADLTGQFEEFGWNYCYHAWREAEVWNMETEPRIFDLFKSRWKKNV